MSLTVPKCRQFRGEFILRHPPALLRYSRSESESMRNQRIHMESRRCLLRPFVADDLDWLTDLVADQEVNRFEWDGVDSREQARRAAEAMIFLDSQRFQFGHWAIQDKNTGAVLGWTALGKLRPWSGLSDEIAVSYVLRRVSWGHGFATEAAGRLVRYAFGIPCLERVMAVIDARNTASKRVLEDRHVFRQLGFGWRQTSPVFPD